MMRSLYSGVAGLKTHQTKMDVIGNNIANVNTVGFKSSSVTFQDIMYQTTSGATGATATTGGTNAKQIGLGVTTGSTKVSITSSGAAQSTGDAFDIKLTDSNSTNFFIVNNGSEKLFTRAGSFYVDGSGNLAMTSTGYYVQGWKAVEDEDGVLTIQKNTVDTLQIMAPDKQTSSPEATTKAYVSGLIDKNDTNVTSDDGYLRTLTFYDNLGYSYTAKFSFKAVDTDAGTYSVELQSITDSNKNDILAEYLEDNPDALDSIFVSYQTRTKTYSIDTSYYTLDGTSVTTTARSSDTELLATALFTGDDDVYTMVATLVQDDDGNYGYYFEHQTNGTVDGRIFRTLNNIYGISTSEITAALAYTTAGTGGLAVGNDGVLTYTYPSTDYTLQFSTADGSFLSIGGDTDGEVSLNLSVLGDSFEDVTMDFSHLLNQNNSGSSTAEITRGTADDASDGAGKKLGTLTGVSIDSNGQIFGSYDNGNTVLLGQIAVAQFANASGLESLGNNCYGTTLNSGDFDGIGVEVTADGGSMATGQLEMSNVDLSAEFTEMITTQRGFQANSRIITVSDTMLEELTNLKR